MRIPCAPNAISSTSKELEAFGSLNATTKVPWETLINGGDATVCSLGERFSCQSRQLTAAGGSGWPGVVRRTEVSCGRDTGLRAPTARTPGLRSWRCHDSAPCDSRTGTSRHETHARLSRAPCRTYD